MLLWQTRLFSPHGPIALGIKLLKSLGTLPALWVHILISTKDSISSDLGVLFVTATCYRLKHVL